MSTERDAFVGSLANFSGIYKTNESDIVVKKELNDKNLKCITAILHLAMHEGNFLSDSWSIVIKVICMIHYYLNVADGGSKEDAYFNMTDRHSGKLDSELEQIRQQNAAYIKAAVDEHDIEKVFSSSINLGSDGIVDLIRCM